MDLATKCAEIIADVDSGACHSLMTGKMDELVRVDCPLLHEWAVRTVDANRAVAVQQRVRRAVLEAWTRTNVLLKSASAPHPDAHAKMRVQTLELSHELDVDQLNMVYFAVVVDNHDCLAPRFQTPDRLANCEQETRRNRLLRFV